MEVTLSNLLCCGVPVGKMTQSPDPSQHLLQLFGSGLSWSLLTGPELVS